MEGEEEDGEGNMGEESDSEGEDVGGDLDADASDAEASSGEEEEELEVLGGGSVGWGDDPADAQPMDAESGGKLHENSVRNICLQTLDVGSFLMGVGIAVR